MKSLVYAGSILAMMFVSYAHANGAAQARLTWAAFECANYAAMTGRLSERKRLLDLGLINGREVIAALNDGRISRAAIEKDGTFFPPQFEGTSTDFMLGIIFGATGQKAGDIVSEATVDKSNLNSMVATAENFYGEKNCALLR